MGLKKAFYSAARLTWVAFVAGAWVSLDQGYTEPWLSVSDIPGGSTGVAAFGVVLALVGYLLISFLHRGAEQADWVEAGQQAGSPSERGQREHERTDANRDCQRSDRHC